MLKAVFVDEFCVELGLAAVGQFVVRRLSTPLFARVCSRLPNRLSAGWGRLG